MKVRVKMKIICITLAVAAILAIAFFILKYHILMNLALNARSRNLLSSGVTLTSAKIFRFLPVTCRVSGRHATGRKENLTAREYK